MIISLGPYLQCSHKRQYMLLNVITKNIHLSQLRSVLVLFPFLGMVAMVACLMIFGILQSFLTVWQKMNNDDLKSDLIFDSLIMSLLDLLVPWPFLI